MAFGTGPLVGLDIGTSAVRAAQVSTGRGTPSLISFGQVALSPGVVVDGEIRDQGAVSEAISQLFKRAKLKGRRVVLGVANQRVVVRQVDLPYLEEKEFRSSLQFQVADHIPMPVDAAELDYQLLGDFTNESGERMMRVLLVAAATDMVESFVGTAAAAGLEPAGVDLTPFAVARAVSPAARGESGAAGAEAIVDVGAGVTSIFVHHNGEPRFVRILLVGGDDATNALANDLGVSFDEAEGIKLDLGRGVGTPDAQRVLQTRVASLVEEIRGSLDYYVSQEESDPVSSIIMTGGGSLTPGLVASVEATVRTQVRRAATLTQMNFSKSGLTQDQVTQVEPVAAAAVGLAMGGSGR
ncbi:MAG: type pilus assembly protein PilM [Actinomycetota bacterium]|jgi:type IV pilus assembly protein PilM|nr:type pilus assembly protein PilM [Actinomycetota bacterium]